MTRRAGRPVACLAAALIALSPAGATGAREGFQAPTPVVRTLANGLTVAIYADDRFPVVQVQLLVEAGAVHEPPGGAGIANLTLQMLSQGTTSRPRLTYAQEVEGLGGSIGGTVGREFSTLSGAFLSRDFEQGLELIGDAMTSPLLDDAPLGRTKEQLTSSLLRLRQNPAALSEDHLWALVHAGHPYERPPQGPLRTIAALTLAQVRSFHRERYRPDRALLAIAGDVTPERAVRAAEEYLGRWAGKVSEFQPVAPSPPTGGGRIRLVDAPGLTTAELRIGSVGPARASKDYDALSLGAEVFRVGVGGPTAAGVLGMKDGGLFWVTSHVPVDSVGVELKRLDSALRAWTEQPPADTALEPVQRRTVASFPLQFETRAGVIGKWTAAAFNGLPVTAIADEPARIGALTAEDIRTTAARWVTPDRMMVVVVGPAETLRSQLEAIGTVEVVSGEVAADVVPTPSTVTGPATAGQTDRGRTVVAQALTAHGGLARLRAIRDSRIEGDLRLMVGSDELVGTAVQLRKEPMRFLFSTEFTAIRTVQVLDGDKGWSGVGEPVEYADLDSVTIVGLRAGFRSDLHHLLMTAADSTTHVTWRGQERLDARDADVVEMVAAYGERRVLFFDAQNHRLVAMEQSEGGHSARRRYADFRDVSGTLWPFAEERLLDGQRAMSLSLRRVTFNSGIRNEAFRRPSATPRRPR